MRAPLPLLLLLAACSSRAPYAASTDRARAIIESYVAVTGVPGLQVAVAVDGRIVWSEAFGVADREAGVVATPESRFRIASISKLMTGTLVAKLAEAGILDLDRPLGEFVPDLPSTWHGITARMLVHHTSGIAHYRDAEDGLDTTHYASTAAALARFRDRPLAHSPGAGETYSSYAYTLLARVVEAATNRPFVEVMEAEVLRPLGMHHTVPDDQRSPPRERTAFYDLSDGGTVVLAPYVDLSGRWAGSGYLSTAEDLARFGLAHTAAGALSDGTRRRIAERGTLPDGTRTREGFGWGPREDWDGRPFLWGDGGTPGARGGLLVYPDDGLVIAILGNARGLSLERGEFQTLARLFLAERGGHPPRAAASRMLARWEGAVPVGDRTLRVELDLREGATARPASLSFANWRTLSVISTFRTGDTTWAIALDRQGMLPVALRADGDVLDAEVPRAGWTFRLTPPFAVRRGKP